MSERLTGKCAICGKVGLFGITKEESEAGMTLDDVDLYTVGTSKGKIPACKDGCHKKVFRNLKKIPASCAVKF